MGGECQAGDRRLAHPLDRDPGPRRRERLPGQPRLQAQADGVRLLGRHGRCAQEGRHHLRCLIEHQPPGKPCRRVDIERGGTVQGQDRRLLGLGDRHLLPGRPDRPAQPAASVRSWRQRRAVLLLEVAAARGQDPLQTLLNPVRVVRQAGGHVGATRQQMADQAVLQRHEAGRALGQAIRLVAAKRTVAAGLEQAGDHGLNPGLEPRARLVTAQDIEHPLGSGPARRSRCRGRGQGLEPVGDRARQRVRGRPGRRGRQRPPALAQGHEHGGRGMLAGIADGAAAGGVDPAFGADRDGDGVGLPTAALDLGGELPAIVAELDRAHRAVARIGTAPPQGLGRELLLHVGSSERQQRCQILDA